MFYNCGLATHSDIFFKSPGCQENDLQVNSNPKASEQQQFMLLPQKNQLKSPTDNKWCTLISDFATRFLFPAQRTLFKAQVRTENTVKLISQQYYTEPTCSLPNNTESSFHQVQFECSFRWQKLPQHLKITVTSNIPLQNTVLRTELRLSVLTSSVGKQHEELRSVTRAFQKLFQPGIKKK